MLCVIAKLDDCAARRITALRDAAVVGSESGPALYGHITAAAYIGNDEAGFIGSCREMLKGITAFTVEFARIEVLEETSIIAAIPTGSPALNLIHQRIVEGYNDSLDQWTKAGSWYPHTTLLYDPQADLKILRDRIKEGFIPFTAAIDRIEFSRVLEQGYEIINSIDLSIP